MSTPRFAVAGLIAMGLWLPSPASAATYWGLGVREATVSVCFVGDALSSRPDRVAQIITELSEFEQVANIRFQHQGSCAAPVTAADGNDFHDGDIRVVLPNTSGTKLASWAGAEGSGPIPGTGCRAFLDASGNYNGQNDGWGSWSNGPSDLASNRACMYNLKLGDDPWNDVPYRNHLLHEFGHALGLSHEHERSDVDNVGCPALGTPTLSSGFLTGYDRESVVHYQFLACGIEGSYGRAGLSARDRLGLHILLFGARAGRRVLWPHGHFDDGTALTRLHVVAAGGQHELRFADLRLDDRGHDHGRMGTKRAPGTIQQPAAKAAGVASGALDEDPDATPGRKSSLCTVLTGGVSGVVTNGGHRTGTKIRGEAGVWWNMSNSRRPNVAVYGLATLLASVGCEPGLESSSQVSPVQTLQSLRSSPLRGLQQSAKPRASPAPSTETSPSAPRCPAGNSIEGKWLSEGYGVALEVNSREFVLYQVSESSCFVDVRGAIDSPCEPALRIALGSDERPSFLHVQTAVRGRTLIAQDAGTLRYAFTRSTRLPARCRAGGTPKSSNPELNFEIFYEHFAEHYAFFALHDVDWAAQYRRHRPLVHRWTSSERLFAIMRNMLAPLEDYHVQLAGDAGRYRRPLPPDIVEHAPAIDTYVLAHYLREPAVTVAGNGLLSYRMLDDEVGYIGLWAMTGFADPDALIAGEDLIESERAGATRALDEALTALSSARALVVDVRFNGGGLDAVALAIASRFADQRRYIYSKAARDGRAYTRPRTFFVEPADARFLKPVVLLTSRTTVSAAEIFVMAMRVLPHVAVVGEPTAGAHSDVMERTLPNGWQIGLSNEVYVAADGTIYEGRGIPPAVEVPLDAPAFAEQRDAIMEEAQSARRTSSAVL